MAGWITPIRYNVPSYSETCVTTGGASGVAEGQSRSSQLPGWGWPPGWELGYLGLIPTSVCSLIWINGFPFLYHCFLCPAFVCRKSECLATKTVFPFVGLCTAVLLSRSEWGGTLGICWTPGHQAPAAVTGWSILQQQHCSCSGTSSSISSQTRANHGKDSFHRLSAPFWFLPSVHSTQTGKQLHSNKQEYLLVKKPQAIVLLGVCASSMMTSLKLG